MRETELYQPVKAYLEGAGYQVNAEVKGCDVVATCGDDVIIVELKVSASMGLLVQATARQAMTDSVYVAVPQPPRMDKQWRGIERVIRRLELGLLIVRVSSLGPSVEKRFDPMPPQRRKSGARRRAIIREVGARSKDYNTGGSTRTPIVTAYRETAIIIATFLESLGEASPARLRALGTGERTTPILAGNYYGWFQRVERGIYRVTPQGTQGIRTWPELWQRSLALLAARIDAPDS